MGGLCLCCCCPSCLQWVRLPLRLWLHCRCPCRQRGCLPCCPCGPGCSRELCCSHCCPCRCLQLCCCSRCRLQLCRCPRCLHRIQLWIRPCRLSPSCCRRCPRRC